MSKKKEGKSANVEFQWEEADKNILWKVYKSMQNTWKERLRKMFGGQRAFVPEQIVVEH